MMMVVVVVVRRGLVMTAAVVLVMACATRALTKVILDPFTIGNLVIGIKIQL